MTAIRAAFSLVFFLAVFLGALHRAESFGWAAVVFGLLGLFLAGAVIVIEMLLSRSFAPYLSSAVYGALMGWLVGVAFSWAADALPGVTMLPEPSLAAAVTTAFMYLGAVAAIRCTAAGHTAIRIKVRRKRSVQLPPDGAVRWLRIVFAIFVVACIAALALSTHVDHTPGPYAALAMLVCASGVDVVAGKRLPSILPVVVPAIFFAIAAAGQTFAFVSLSASLNYYISLEFQQAAIFVLWLYVGMSLMLHAKLTGNCTVPLVAFEEKAEQ